jgi:hypothetical protein
MMNSGLLSIEGEVGAGLAVRRLGRRLACYTLPTIAVKSYNHPGKSGLGRTRSFDWVPGNSRLRRAAVNVMPD